MVCVSRFRANRHVPGNLVCCRRHAIASTFRRPGFAEVIEREDLTRAKLEEVLKNFGDEAAEVDWAVIITPATASRSTARTLLFRWMPSSPEPTTSRTRR